MGKGMAARHLVTDFNPVFVQQCMCLSTMQNGSLTSALCVDVGAAERNARKSART